VRLSVNKKSILCGTSADVDGAGICFKYEMNAGDWRWNGGSLSARRCRTYIRGISAYCHDSAACLVMAGEIVEAA